MEKIVLHKAPAKVKHCSTTHVRVDIGLYDECKELAEKTEYSAGYIVNLLLSIALENVEVEE